MKILIAGAGNMGTTYAHSFIHSASVGPEQLFFLDRRPEVKESLTSLSNHEVHRVPGSWVSEMDLVVLSVKPQDFPTLAAQLAKWMHAGQQVMSIMAGITLSGIQRALGVEKVIRAMPNLPSQVGQGMTVFTASEQVSSREILLAQNLLNTTGKTLYVQDEALIDAATAISGSGPAFVFYYMEAMNAAARQMGFSESEAQLLVTQTFLGSLDLLTRNSHTASEWIRRVASKGGTTEAGIARFEQANLRDAIGAGLTAARDRAGELSKVLTPPEIPNP